MLEEAARVATEIGLDFALVDFDLEQFRKGMDVELEHGKVDPDTDVTNDNALLTGKIAWAHLKERPDYYELLDMVEQGYKPVEDKGRRIDLHMTAGVRRTWHERFRRTHFDKGANKMSQHPQFIRVQGQLFKLEEEEPQQPEYIKVGGVVFQKVPAELIEAAKKKSKSKKKDDDKDEKKGKGKKKSKKDDKKGKPAKEDKKKKKVKSKDKKEKAKPGKSKGKWADLPKGWTKKSAESFWNSIGGSVTECRKKLKDAEEIDNTGAFCASLKDRLQGEDWRKGPKKSKKKKKASTNPPRSIRVNGKLYLLDD